VEAVYSFMLPRDAALRRFRVSGPGFAARSELRPVEEATEAYEEGIERGHLATMARAYRDGMVNLSVGNLRSGEPVTVLLEVLAGVDLQDDGLRFRFPFTVAPSYHSSSRSVGIDDSALEVELPADEFGDLLLPQFRDCREGLHEVGFDLSVDAPGGDLEVASPSHNIRVGMKSGRGRVSTAAADGVPNRDLVLDVRAGRPERRVLAGPCSDGRMHFAATIPSVEFGAPVEGPRSVVFVLDRSGSMGGEPIERARRALLACLSTLNETDRFSIVAFDNTLEAFSKEMVNASRKQRDRAAGWLHGIDARGGTELAQAVRYAGKIAAGPGADLFVLTDGQVWGTDEILADAGNTGVRLHTLGIGSASQDRFLTLLSRETHGVARFVAPRERVDAAALDWFASVSAPVAVGVAVRTSKGVVVEPAPAEAVFQGKPLFLMGSSESAQADVKVVADAVELALAVEAGEQTVGETVRLVRGSRLITDAESRIGEEGSRPLERRKRVREMRRLENLSREYGLASQAMALVAVVERAGDRPGEIPDTQVIPVGLPEGMEMGGLIGGFSDFMTCELAGAAPAAQRVSSLEGRQKKTTLLDRAVDLSAGIFHWIPDKPEPDEEGDLMDLAASIEPDGGMPGDSREQRILASLLALLAFTADGSSLNSGPFRKHVKRLLDFLDSGITDGLDDRKRAAARTVVRAAEEGKAIEGDWLDHARSASLSTGTERASAWEALQSAMAGGT
jgi:Ca-activated chloride channel family protein